MIYNPILNRSRSIDAVIASLLDMVPCPEKPFSGFSASFSSTNFTARVYLQKIYTQPEEEF